MLMVGMAQTPQIKVAVYPPAPQWAWMALNLDEIFLG
jgi:hypothetical protein